MNTIIIYLMYIREMYILRSGSNIQYSFFSLNVKIVLQNVPSYNSVIHNKHNSSTNSFASNLSQCSYIY